MNPPWIEYPDYPPRCLGWRMGSGEDYMGDWYKFIRAFSKKELEEYIQGHPAPAEWEDTYNHFRSEAK
jgi:hypothetical protein